MKAGPPRAMMARRVWLSTVALAVLLSISLIVTPVGSASSCPSETAPRLTLDCSVKHALSHSADVELARLAVLEAEIAFKEAEIDRLSGGSHALFLDAERALQDARIDFVESLMDVALQVEEAYYQVLRTAEASADQEASVKQAQRQWEIASARYDAGLIARHELDHIAHRLEEARYHADSADVRMKDAWRELSAMMGENSRSLGAVQVDPDAIQPFESFDVPLVQALEEARDSRREIAAAARALASARRAYNLAQSTLEPPIHITRLAMEVERAEIQLAKARVLVDRDITRSYRALTDAHQSVTLREGAADLAAQRSKIARARYDGGEISFLDLVVAEAEVAQARSAATGAIWDYNLEKARFLRKIGRSDLPPLPVEIAQFMSEWSL